MPRLVEVPGYVRFWTASAVSAFGSQITGLALQVLTAVALGASATEGGVVSAARWLPYLLSGLFLASVKAPDPVPERGARRSVGSELREGVSWVYRHRTLASIALTSHAMLLFNSMVSTVFVVFALHELRIGSFGLGVTYACAGVGAVLGGAISGRIVRSLEVGATLVVFRVVAAVGWLPLVLARSGPWALASVAFAYFTVSLAIGIESPVEMSYRQSVTPDRLRGRMNATIRSMNWGMVAVGAPLGGILADRMGHRFALVTALAGAVAQALALAVSPTRRARADNAPARKASC